MKKYKFPFRIVFLLFLVALAFFSCKKKKALPSPVVTLSSDNIKGKSGQKITVLLKASAVSGIQVLKITKNVNLVIDSSFGNDGVLEVESTQSDSLYYTFTYTLKPEEVNKLVGFLFRVTGSNGKVTEKDLTINTTVSKRQLLTMYRWDLESKFHLNTNTEEITDCESDDSFTFNWDSTMTINYGDKACSLDGLNVYTGWKLSTDEKTLTITYASVFDPSQITNEVYAVKTLNKDKLVMDITLDLTAFGLTDHEVYEYTYVTSPK